MRAINGKGKGVFATEDIPAGTTIAAAGGPVRSQAEVDALPEELRHYTLQVDHGMHIVCYEPAEDPTCFFNHSCDPSFGIVGTTLYVAMHKILAGDELTFDYAMTESAPFPAFDCFCGTETCRGLVTSEDWRSPELQARYRGFMSSYLFKPI